MMIKIVFEKNKNRSVAYDDNIQIAECSYAKKVIENSKK